MTMICSVLHSAHSMQLMRGAPLFGKIRLFVGCLLFAACAMAGLPSGYTQVTYLYFDSNCRFSIPVTFSTPDGYGLAIKANVAQRLNSYGPHIVNAGNLWIVYRNSGIYLGQRFEGKELKGYYENNGIDQDIALDLNADGDGRNYVNGTRDYTQIDISDMCAGSLLIGQYAGGSGYGFKGKLYYLRLYDHGTVKMNLVPCVKADGNVPGLYDIENPDPDTAFFTNLGTGTVTPGETVVSSTLTVAAFPFEDAAADVNPSYGIHLDYEVGQQYQLTAPDNWTNSVVNERAECIGWVLYGWDGSLLDWVSIDSGNNGTCAYTHTESSRKLTWQWRHFHLFHVDVIGKGVTLSSADQWVEHNTYGTLSAHLSKRSLTLLWRGNGISRSNHTNATVSIYGDGVKNLSVMAVSKYLVFAPTMTREWQRIDDGYSTLKDVHIDSAVSSGSSISNRGMIYPYFPRIDGNVLSVQFQQLDPANAAMDQYYLKSMKIEFKVEDGVLYARAAENGMRYIMSDGRLPGEYDFDTQSSNVFHDYDICNICLYRPYESQPLYLMVR